MAKLKRLTAIYHMGFFKRLLATAILGSSIASAAMEVSLNNNILTFTFLPEQSAPLDPGAAYYTSSDTGSLHFITWTGGDAGGLSVNLPVISNTFIDNTGTAVADGRVRTLRLGSDSVVLGFGNTLTDFTIAGGSLTLDATGRGLVLPEETVFGFLDGSSYTPGTTGTTGELIPVPEPSTYAALFGLGALGLAAWRRKSKA